MASLCISSSALLLDGLTVDLESASPGEITQHLRSKPRLSRLDNDIYTWDTLGVYAYCKPKTEKIDAVAVALTAFDYPFAPKSPFEGTITWEASVFELPHDNAKFALFVKKEAKQQGAKVSTYLSLGLGRYSVVAEFDTTKKYVRGISISVAEELEDFLPPIDVPSDRGVEFTDLNFKLMVIQELMYNQKVLTPRFDVHEFARRYTKRKLDIDEEGYDMIPEVREFFESYPVPASLLNDLQSLRQDGGDEIYLQLIPFWDGEDNTFNIRSATDAVLLPNLKKVVLFFDDGNDTILKDFRKLGIDAESL